MIKGFKDFIMRGNVIDLAIAVVIGTAFAAVVSVVTSAIIKPIIAAFPGASVNGWGFSLRGGDLKSSTFIDLSAVVNAVIVFLITAAVVYFLIVVPMNKIQERRAARLAQGEPDPEPKPEDVQLLEQIRDLLAQQRPAGPAGGMPPAGGVPPTGAY